MSRLFPPADSALKELQALPDDAPVLILLPGLTGGGDDSYVRYAVHHAETHGTRAVVFNSRGCGDTFVTTPRYYSGLYIGDMQRVVHAVRLRHPRSLMFSAGWSLGANILTNYLGFVGEDTPLDAAAVMCNPFDLVLGSQKLKEGFNQCAPQKIMFTCQRSHVVPTLCVTCDTAGNSTSFGKLLTPRGVAVQGIQQEPGSRNEPADEAKSESVEWRGAGV